MRVVFDASVIMRMAFFSDNYAREAISIVEKGAATLVMCPEIHEDWMAGFCKVYAKTIEKGHRLQIRKLIQCVLGLGSLIERGQTVALGVMADYSPDPGDNKYIQCAIDGNADYIISQDGEHLIALTNTIPNAEGKLIQVVSPFQFMAEYKLQGRGYRVSNLR
jgi:predicted nucleic acid-binding protein